MLSTIFDALTSAEFLIGLRNGAFAWVVAMMPLLVRNRAAPLSGLLWVAAATAGLWVVSGPPTVLIGLVLLALAGAVHPHLGSFAWVGPLLALPGGWLVATRSGLGGPAWVPWAILIAVVVGGPLMAATVERLEPSGISLLMWVMTVGGVFGTVPDTEEILVLLGASVFLGVLGVWNLSRFGAAGAYAAVGLLSWVAATGGVGRPASIVGALACLGVFLVAPLAILVRDNALASWPVVLVVHVVLVALASRVAGLQESVFAAGTIGAGGLLVGLVALVVAGGRVRSYVRGAQSSSR